MDARLSSKSASEVSIFVCFSISIFSYVLIQRPPSWRWRTVYITVWNHLTMMAVGQGMYTSPVDPSEQFPDSISTCDVNRGYSMLLLILFVLLLFVCFFLFSFLLFFFVHFFPFFRDNHVIFITRVEFRYYVVIIILVDLKKR